MARYTYNVQALKYDGTNSSAIISAANDYFIAAANGNNFVSGSVAGNGTITIYTDQYNFTMVSDQWLVQDKETVWATNNTAHFNVFYRPAPAVQSSTGNALVPLLTASAETTVSVTLVPALADSNYSVSSSIVGNSASLLDDLDILSTTIVDSDTVDVVIKNNGLISLSGANVFVTAVRIQV